MILEVILLLVEVFGEKDIFQCSFLVKQAKLSISG